MFLSTNRALIVLSHLGSWSSMDSSQTADTSRNSTFFPNLIWLISKREGWAVGDSGIIVHTTDGHNWFEQTNPKIGTFFDVEFLNSKEGWAVGTNGAILHTINGGTTWTVEAEGKTANKLTGISAPSPDCVYICGNNGTLLKYNPEN